MIILDIMSWPHFVQLHGINHLPIEEQVKRYNYYLMEQQALQTALINQQVVGSGGKPAQPPFTCLEFTANTVTGTSFAMEFEVSTAVTYSINWGDGTVLENVAVDAGEIELTHEYPESDTEYTASLCFSDSTAVTSINFYGDD
jgi:hypothetical protein